MTVQLIEGTTKNLYPIEQDYSITNILMYILLCRFFRMIGSGRCSIKKKRVC